jgi:tetratricopeptide (TPR) repeat protein
MANRAERPTIFISYSHKDEPDIALYPNANRWLTFVTSHLGPAEAHGHLELWDDRSIEGGGDWKKQIDDALSRCAVCILLVSRHSLTSRFILDVEMRQILERHYARGAQLYPIVITACDVDAAKWLLDLNLRPRDGVALEVYSDAQRNSVMAALAKEMRNLVAATEVPTRSIDTSSQLVDITRLPETAYERLVGRDDEIRLLDDAWQTSGTNILSLIAWGGAGKTTLINDWLKRSRLENYRGAEAVLGWSFYDQGTKERATSADLFLEWALTQLGMTDVPKDANLRGELLSDTLKGRRVLLVLDGVEPLQYGPGPQEGLLKDVGLKSFLRRFAAEPPSSALGLVVLTSRLKLKDLGRGSATLSSTTILELEQLSDEAGAELLADNGVVGNDRELREATREFGGHALALSLLAGFLARRHGGDIRRRDSIGPLLIAHDRTVDEFVHGHAKRVMSSIESEWLKDQPVLHAIMNMVSLFDRPARAELLNELTSEFLVNKEGGSLENLSSDYWLDAVSDLRAVRLLAPADPSAPDDLDTHPLVRDWFSSRLEGRDLNLWRSAHRRVYEFLKNNTDEGALPTLASLQPLYQAIAHGCKAGRYEDALYRVYFDRIAKMTANEGGFVYSAHALGGLSTDVAMLSQFFEKPFDRPKRGLSQESKMVLMSNVASMLGQLGRTQESAQTLSSLFREAKSLKRNPSSCRMAAVVAGNFAHCTAMLGNITEGLSIARTGMTFANQAVQHFDSFATAHGNYAELLFLSGKLEEAYKKIAEIEAKRSLSSKLIQSSKLSYLNVKALILIYEGRWKEAKDVSELLILGDNVGLQFKGFSLMIQARANFGELLEHLLEGTNRSTDVSTSEIIESLFNKSIAVLRTGEAAEFLAQGYIYRAIFWTALGKFALAKKDLEQAEEIATAGSMTLLVADIAIQLARIDLSRQHRFTPLAFTPTDKITSAKVEEPLSTLHDSVAQLNRAAELLERTGYRLRATEIPQLLEVVAGTLQISELPIRV